MLSKLSNNIILKRVLMLFLSSIIILTTAQSCSIPGFRNNQTPATLGLLKKGDPRSKSDKYIKINAVKQLDGNISVDGLSGISGIKLVNYNKDTLYFLTSGKGLFKTTDGGYTWQRKYIFKVQSNKTDQKQRDTEINNLINLNNSVVFTDLAIDPSNENIIYLAGKYSNFGKIYQSIDGGETFNEIYTEINQNIAVNLLAINPQRPLRVFAVLSGGSLIRSNDGGVTWQKIQSFEETPIQINFIPEFDNKFFILFPKNGIAFSDNDGDKWNLQKLSKRASIIGEEQSKDSFDFGFGPKELVGIYEKIIPVTADKNKNSWILIADSQLWYSRDINANFAKLVLPLENEKQNLYDAQPDPTLGLEKILISLNDRLFETRNQGRSWNVIDNITMKIGNIRQILIVRQEGESSNAVYLLLSLVK